MRLIDADKLCEDLFDRWSIADARKEELIRRVMADIVTPIIASQPTDKSYELWKESYEALKEDYDCLTRCDDAISRKDAIKSMASVMWNYPNELYPQLNCYENCVELAKRGLECLPSIQPGIIRCKDCKHYYYADNRIPQEQRYSCGLDGDRWKPEDFCSYAERRTDEGFDQPSRCYRRT